MNTSEITNLIRKLFSRVSSSIQIDEQWLEWTAYNDINSGHTRVQEQPEEIYDKVPQDKVVRTENQRNEPDKKHNFFHCNQSARITRCGEQGGWFPAKLTIFIYLSLVFFKQYTYDHIFPQNFVHRSKLTFCSNMNLLRKYTKF
jgi:hypothetical protein